VTSECILPFLENALVDQEERVVAQSARCITTLVQLQLLSRLMTVDAVGRAAPLLLHPRPTIRQAALSLVEAAAEALGSIDATVFLLPLLRPALAYTLSGVGLTAESLAEALMDPLSWRAYRRSLSDRLNTLISTTNNDEFIGSDRSHARHSEDEVEIGIGKRETGKKGIQQTEASMADSWFVSSAPVGINGDGNSSEDRSETLVHRSKVKESEWVAPSSAGHAMMSGGKHVEGEIGLTQDSMHYPSRHQATATVPFEDAAEPTKLQYMEGYVDLVTREMLSRATQVQGRGQVSSSFLRQPEGSDSDVIKRRAELLSQGLMLVPQTPSLAATGLSEGLTHSLLVPHQQYGNIVVPAVHTAATSTAPTLAPIVMSSPVSPSFIAEVDREAASKILTLPSSTIIIDGGGLTKAAVLGIFGVQVNDSHRSDISFNASKYVRNRGALSLASARQGSRPSVLVAESSGARHTLADMDKAMNAVEALSSSATADADSKGLDIHRDSSEGDPVHAVSGAADGGALSCEDLGTMFVINRLRALKVPPLPPDLGSLQHANGKPYR
jgi:hypothetical protein